MKLYDFIYFYVYYAKRGDNTIDAFATICFSQTFNIITLLNLLFFLTKILNNYKFEKVYLIILILTIILNYYIYLFKKRGAKIINDEKYSLGKYSFFVPLYFIFSVFMEGFTYYIFKEW